MTLSALGIFSAAGAGGVVALSDYELIETQILGSAQSSVVFSNLGTYSSTYKHLQIRGTVRVSRNVGVNSSDLSYRINGDTGTNYSYHLLAGDGSSVASSAGTSTNFGYVGSISSAGDTANSFSGFVFDLLDSYSTTKNKTVRSILAKPSTSPSLVGLYSGLWRNTSSTTSITFYDLNGTNFVVGCRFSIYGLKG